MKAYEDDTGVPRNVLGLSSAAELTKREYLITATRIAELELSPVEGRFDMQHLRAIHRHIFQDVYGWAGKERTLNFSKATHMPGFKGVFADHQAAAGMVDEIGRFIAERDNLRGLSKEAFVDAMVELYPKLNRAHPFPEGNGRSTQAFLVQLAEQAGHTLEFARVQRAEWNRAAAMSMGMVHRVESALHLPPDTRPIREMFTRMVDASRNLDRTVSDPGR